MRDENCKRAAAATRHSVSLRQSPAVPFAFPMLRCTAPKEWTLHCTATTSPPWPLCCLLYCSVLACLRRDYPCGREERKDWRRCSLTLYLLCAPLFYQNCIFNCVKSSDVILLQLFFQAALCGFSAAFSSNLQQTHRWHHLHDIRQVQWNT